MSAKKDAETLAQVKTALAKKYMNLAKLVKSKPRQKTWLALAGKLQRQAEQAKQKAR